MPVAGPCKGYWSTSSAWLTVTLLSPRMQNFHLSWVHTIGASHLPWVTLTMTPCASNWSNSCSVVGLVVNGAVLGQKIFGWVSGRIFSLTLKDLLSQFVSGQHTVLVQQPLKSDLWFWVTASSSPGGGAVTNSNSFLGGLVHLQLTSRRTSCLHWSFSFYWTSTGTVYACTLLWVWNQGALICLCFWWLLILLLLYRVCC